MEHVIVVAEAAGGFLGIGKISVEERNMITHWKKHFAISKKRTINWEPACRKSTM